MNQLSGNKVLLTLIAILLITNVVMLVLFLRIKKPPVPPENKRLGFTEKLKNQVGFTDDQMAIFEPKKKAFWKNVRERFDEIKKTKENFYYLLYDSTISDSILQARAELIGRQQEELDLHVIRHFREIRKLCTPQQLPKYDSLLPPLIKRMTARPERK